MNIRTHIKTVTDVREGCEGWSVRAFLCFFYYHFFFNINLTTLFGHAEARVTLG